MKTKKQFSYDRHFCIKYVEKLNNAIEIPLRLTIDGSDYVDTEQCLNGLIFYGERSFSTSAPTLGQYIDIFANGSAMHISLNSKMSSAYETASLASRQFCNGKTFVYDSLKISFGVYLLLKKATELYGSKQDIENTNDLDKYRDNIINAILAFTPEFIEKGGRSKGHAILEERVGPHIYHFDKQGFIYLEPFISDYLSYFTRFIENNNIDRTQVYVDISDISEQILNEIRIMLSRLDFKHIVIGKTVNALSSHVGPNGIIFTFVNKTKGKRG
jgi:hypothetical protein